MDFRRELGQQLRVDSVRASAAAGSGHPTSSMSAADLIAVLLDGHLRLDLAHPDDPRNLHIYAARLEAFGWHAIEVDGHDVNAIEAAYADAEATRGQPTAILARTKKGRGVAAVEDQPGNHGKPHRRRTRRLAARPSNGRQRATP